MKCLMKINAIRALNKEQILELLQSLYRKEAGFALLKHTRNEKTNTAAWGQNKKAIARCLTLLREAELN